MIDIFNNSINQQTISKPVTINGNLEPTDMYKLQL